jgi:hypothetical protein
MKKSAKFLLLALCWSLFGNWQVIPSAENEIIGIWHSVSNNNGLIYDFRPDNQYTICNADSSILITDRYEILPDVGILKQYIGEDYFKVDYKVFDNKLIFMYNKGFINHISYLVVLEKGAEKTGNVEMDLSPPGGQQIVLPLKYRGIVIVSYNQKEGQEKNYTADNRPLISIPANGLLQTQFEEEPYNYILGKISFSVSDSNTVKRNIKFFSFDKYYHNLDELLGQGYYMDSVYVCTYGYNRLPRKEINKLYGKPIEGNVMMFSIDTLKNLILNPIDKNSLLR